MERRTFVTSLMAGVATITAAPTVHAVADGIIPPSPTRQMTTVDFACSVAMVCGCDPAGTLTDEPSSYSIVVAAGTDVHRSTIIIARSVEKSNGALIWMSQFFVSPGFGCQYSGPIGPS